MTQNDRVLDLLKSGFSMNAIEARAINIFHLHSRISDLKALGHPIATAYEVIDGQKFARYRIAA